MAVTHGLGTYGNAVGTVTPLEHRLAQSGLIKKASGNTIRPGLFWGGVANIVTGRANMAYDVAAFTGALTRGATAGTVLLANDGVVTVTTTTAPVSNSRIDVIYVWQRDFALDGVDSNPVIGVVQGAAAVSPTAPSLAAFPGAIELARATIPAGITATTSATITQTFPITTTDGGVDWFPDNAARDRTIFAPVPDQRVSVGTRDYIYNGAQWIDRDGPGQFADGSGGGNITTGWTASSAPASLTLGPGTWSVAASIYFTMSTAARVDVNALLWNTTTNGGIGNQQEFAQAVGAASVVGTQSFTAEFTRVVTVTATTTIQIWRRTSATGGTQATAQEHLVATRIA
jgi:hypothetical protein